MRSSPVILLLAAAALAGCATQAPPVEPLAGVVPPAAWSQPEPPAAGPVADWWQAFGDPLLVQLVADTQAANTGVEAARARLRQARASRAQAAAALWPSLSTGAGAQRSRTAGAGSSNRFEAGLDAAWEADVFGAIRHGVAAEDALVRATAAALAATRVSVAAEAALAYLDLRTAQQREAVARENLASQEETLQISRWREQAGLASSLEVEQASGAVEQTRAQLPLLRAAAAQAAHALAVLAGQPPAALLARLSAPADVPQPGAAFAIDIPARVLRQRPDLLAAEQELQAAAARVARADALRWPGVHLGASLAWSGLTLGALGSASAARALFASIEQPLFDAGRRDAQLAASQAAFDLARAGYRASVLAALQEVEDALAGLAADRTRLAALQRALAAARNASLLATQRHASGLIDFQVVLETQRTLLSVQDSVVGAQAALAVGHVRLYKALGGGWTPGAPEAAS